MALYSYGPIQLWPYIVMANDVNLDTGSTKIVTPWTIAFVYNEALYGNKPYLYRAITTSGHNYIGP